MTRRKMPDIIEALGRYTKPSDAVMMLQQIANEVDAASQRAGCTELVGIQAVKALGQTCLTDLRVLQREGCPVRGHGSAMTLDCRDFRRWIDEQCRKASRRPWRDPSETAQAQGALI